MDWVGIGDVYWWEHSWVCPGNGFCIVRLTTNVTGRTEFTISEYTPSNDLSLGSYFSLHQPNVTANSILIGTMMVRNGFVYKTATMTNCKTVNILAYTFT